MDIKTFKANQFKDTLSPNWNRAKLKDAKQKYLQENNQNSASKFNQVRMSRARNETASPTGRGSIDQTTAQILASNYTKMASSHSRDTSPHMFQTMRNFANKSEQVPLMGKTVTNFSAIKYRDNGGLFP